VPTKQAPIVKNWFKIGSIAFGVSCGCTLPFTQNLAQSALIGLAAMPGVGASMITISRQRQRQADRQLARGRLRLHQWQQRRTILNQQLQVRHQDCQAIESRVSQLHSLAASLTDRINTDQQQQQQLEQQLSVSIIYCQEQEHIAANLDRKVLEKQALFLEVDTDLNTLKLELSQVQSDQIQLTSANNRAKKSLQDLQAQIDKYWATKQELELQIQQLQSHKIIGNGEFDQSVEQKYLLLQELDLAISDRQKDQQNLTGEITQLEQNIAQKVPELAIQSQILVDMRSQLSEAELALQAKQVELAELTAVILAVEIPQGQDNLDPTTQDQDPLSDRLLQRELKIAQLELSSRQAELDNLEFKLQNKLQSISELDLADSFQTFEPQPPIVDRDIDEIVCVDEWCDKFIDNPHLTVLKHIEKHGTITESEASKKLGNARSVRQFANKLEEYAEDLPFSIRVESSPKGNRYLKEDRN
jgi:chromosome segregation ATPase